MVEKDVFSQIVTPVNTRVYLSVLSEKERQLYLDSLPLAEGLRRIGAFNEAEIWTKATNEDTLIYCIWHKETDEYMGYCSYQGLNSEEPHVGIELISDYQGLGYGKEVARILIDEFFARTGRTALYWRLFRINSRSARLAEKMGGKLILEQSKMVDALGERAKHLTKEELEKYRNFDLLVYLITHPGKESTL